MVHLKYKLSEEEAVQYYEMISSNARETRTARIFAMIWFPALAAALTIVLKKGGNLIWMAVTVFLCLVWIVFLAPRLFRDVVRTAAKRKLRANDITRSEIDVIDDHGTFMVNGADKKPSTYFAYFDLFIVAFDDGTNLIIPARAFEGNDSQMETFMRDVVTASSKQQ